MTATPSESHRDTARQWSEAFNAHDAVGVAALYAEDAVVAHPSYPEPLRGRRSVQDDARAYMTAMPDVTSELVRVLVDGDWVASELVISGVHAGPLVLATGKQPPTGRRLRFTVAFFCRICPQGKVVEERRYYDAAEILRQLGGARQ